MNEDTREVLKARLAVVQKKYDESLKDLHATLDSMEETRKAQLVETHCRRCGREDGKRFLMANSSSSYFCDSRCRDVYASESFLKRLVTPLMGFVEGDMVLVLYPGVEALVRRVKSTEDMPGPRETVRTLIHFDKGVSINERYCYLITPD